MPSARRAALGRHRQRHREQRQQQHHHHLDQPEMEIGARRGCARPACAAVAAVAASSSRGRAPRCSLPRPRKRSIAGRLIGRSCCRRPASRGAGELRGCPGPGGRSCSRNRIVSGSSVARKRAALGGRRDAHAAVAVVDAREDAVAARCRCPRCARSAASCRLPSSVELADLDRGAERARAQVEPQLLDSDSANKAGASRRSQKLSEHQHDRVDI